jgi:hypothetical protein
METVAVRYCSVRVLFFEREVDIMIFALAPNT